MRITVLGKSPSWQDVGGACSGYLVQEEDYALLLDCGNGVFSKLRHHVDYVDVDAVLISHLHADHFLDLVPFSYALTYAPRQQPSWRNRWQATRFTLAKQPAAAAMPEPPARTDEADTAAHPVASRSVIRPLADTDPRRVGPFRVRFCEVPHYTPTFAVEIANGASRLTYSADCSPNQELVDFAQGTDLLLIEATLPRPERTGERGHLTPEEAGQHGRQAAAKRMVITHFSDELDAEWAGREATSAFGAPVALAHEGAVYTV